MSREQAWNWGTSAQKMGKLRSQVEGYQCPSWCIGVEHDKLPNDVDSGLYAAHGI